MTYNYLDPERATEPHALPNVEVFYRTLAACAGDDRKLALLGEPPRWAGEGWYWWICSPGCLPDSDPTGPFSTEEAAVADAQNLF